MGFHIVLNDNQSYIFFYHPIDPTGLMDSFLLKNSEIASLMLKYFEVLWNESASLHHGKRVVRKGLTQIEQLDPGIVRDKNFITLSEQAKLYL
jgi:hypothetical protein